MRRFTCLLLAFAALACMLAGCRRLSSEKTRKPVQVEAGDYIDPPRMVKVEEFRKKEKGEQPIVVNINFGELLGAIGKVYSEFLEPGKAPKLTMDNLKLTLRRRDFDRARKAIEDKTIVVVLEADPAYPNHVLAHRAVPEGDVYESVLVNQAIENIKEKEFMGRLTKQKLQAIYARYKAYAAQAQQEKSLAQFSAYLKANAQPALVDAVTAQAIRVNLAAQPGNNQQLVACFAKAVENSGFGNAVLPGIMGDGSIKGLTPAEMQKIFQGQ